jgi:MFS family permease
MNSPASTQPEVSVMRLAMLGLGGTSIEWYDFFLYGLGSALVFPTLFFPANLPHSVALIGSFLTFAAGFVARPIGGLLFGSIGDRIGRKQALAAALVLMGVATTAIACLPTYAMIGPAAPLLLVLLRVLQGLAIGGQWGGAVLLVLESAPGGRRGFYSSFAQMGAPVGIVLANLAFLAVGAITTTEEFMAWGWRLPFLVSVLLIGFGLYVHFRVEETAAYRELMRTSRATQPRNAESPLLEVLRKHPREITLATISQFAVNLCFYVNVTFVMSYGTDPSGPNLPRSTMLMAVLIASALTPPMTMTFGSLSDRFGRRRLYMIGAVLAAIANFGLFPLIDTRSLLWITVGCLMAAVPVTMMYGPQAALFGELFPTRLRYSGASFSYQTGAILGGAFAPLIATALIAHFHTTIAVSCYMAAACVLAFFAVASLRETAGVRLDEVGQYSTKE